jgi:glycogen debranching enzyme
VGGEALGQAAPLEAANPNHSRLALKQGKHFMVLALSGMMPDATACGYGLYCDDTRYLSRWELTLNQRDLVLLSSSCEEGFTGSFVYGNPALPGLPEQSLMVRRQLVVVGDGMHEKLTVSNYRNRPAEVELTIRYAADFADMFEVRAQRRARRGQYAIPRQSRKGRRVLLGYTGLDGALMQTAIDFLGRRPDYLDAFQARFALKLGPRQSQALEVAVTTRYRGREARSGTSGRFDNRLAELRAGYERWRAAGASISTDNATFNELLERCYRDLYMLRQPTPRGPALAAGIPWFAVAFGRDQAITAMQTLPLMPGLSREVIGVLAAYQGTGYDDYTEESPGRIMHELRLGEMARLREIPFVPYYGTVDATALWLRLLCRYVEWTWDLGLARRLWPRVRQALAYLDREIEAGGGYLRYGGRGDAALTNQGWKDSGDSVMYRDGELARPPVALCEPQGYLYAAWRQLSRLAAMLGHPRVSARLARQASALKQRFNQDFWMEAPGFVALALDGQGRQCDVISSNPGHLLATAILDDARAASVAETLMGQEMFCGWGIRTLSAGERAYNPMSYHNGSVWPHDNSLAVEGLCAIGRRSSAHAVMAGLFEAARHQADLRLPELFCGFERAGSAGPVRYPVSCVPQAWAAGSMLQMLTACLGLVPDAKRKELHVVSPSLPSWLGAVTVTGLRVGDGAVDLRFVSAGDHTSCQPLTSRGGVRVVVQ